MTFDELVEKFGADAESKWKAVCESGGFGNVPKMQGLDLVGLSAEQKKAVDAILKTKGDK